MCARGNNNDGDLAALEKKERMVKQTGSTVDTMFNNN